MHIYKELLSSVQGQHGEGSGSTWKCAEQAVRARGGEGLGCLISTTDLLAAAHGPQGGKDPAAKGLEKEGDRSGKGQRADEG